MKFALFAAAVLALASAPTYSKLISLLDQNGVLVNALVPGTAPLFEDEKKASEPAVIASAD
jgi:non-ribosomal peptide synthetase component E (peptide arylation enzyme)